MSSPYEQFSTDDDLEQTGIVLDYGSYNITVARAGGANRRYTAELAKRMKPYARMVQTDTLPEELARKVMLELYADTVILGWENVTGKDGKQLAFNRDNVITLMSDLPDLFTDIRTQSQNAALFRTGEIEETAKN